MIICIIGLMTILQIALICSLMKRLPTVLAGDSDHFAFRHELIRRESGIYKDENGEYLDKSDYDVYVVRGNSMSQRSIFDGNKVLVAKYENIENINGHPAIVLKLNNSWFFSKQPSNKTFHFIH